MLVKQSGTNLHALCHIKVNYEVNVSSILVINKVYPSGMYIDRHSLSLRNVMRLVAL